MPVLRRQGAYPLLKVVNGRKHASDDDHEDEQPATKKSKDETTVKLKALAEAQHKAATQSDRIASRSSQRASSDGSQQMKKQTMTSSAPLTGKRIPSQEFRDDGRGLTSSSQSAPSSSFMEDMMGSSIRRKQSERKYGSGAFGSKSTRKIDIARPTKKANVSSSGSDKKYSAEDAAAQAVEAKFARLAGFPDTKLSDQSLPISDRDPSRIEGLIKDYNILPAGERAKSVSHGAAKLQALHTKLRLAATKASKPSAPSSPPLSPLPSDDDLDEDTVLELHGVDVQAKFHTQKHNHTITTTTQCPMCSQPVSQKLIERFAVQHPDFPASIRRQRLFCKSHRTTTAKEEYKARGYPDINWKLFTIRLEKHKPKLISILRNPSTSFFRRKFQDRIKESRTSAAENTTAVSGSLASKSVSAAKRTSKIPFWRRMEDETLDWISSSTGYYGLRGADAMTEFISRSLASELSHAVNSDSLIRQCGLAIFTQFVLVAELAVLLAKEDLGFHSADVDDAPDDGSSSNQDEEARRMLEEAAEIGGLVHGKVEVIRGEGSAGDEDDGLSDENGDRSGEVEVWESDVAVEKSDEQDEDEEDGDEDEEDENEDEEDEEGELEGDE